ncbi:Regulator of chromosome condensation (RCC1) repeat [Carpediemonas membranifera]|uniref:Regulator of chromosome condensation (RCC1) repeat n=1 Tax=Carpediemonas membranifera TaxID=201153 RepID=A0A8J6ASD9_9EUKA|nr:Regulator of chromosome condensation (RCC1) repeat [Carpediemonas membranifera]|eukprot:KAG9393256.1 Regulator of chromosome condensation (RCC1) repeat [Carpediemonas membranifera]
MGIFARFALLVLLFSAACTAIDINPAFYRKALAETESMFVSCQQDILGISGNANRITCYYFGTTMPDPTINPVVTVDACWGTSITNSYVKAGTSVSGTTTYIHSATFDVPEPTYVPNYNRYNCLWKVSTAMKVLYSSDRDILLSMTHDTVTFDTDADWVYVAGDNSAGQIDSDTSKANVDVPTNLWSNAPFNYEAIANVEIGDSAFVITDEGELWSLGGTKYPGHTVGSTDVWRQIIPAGTDNIVFTQVSVGAKHAIFLGYDKVTTQNHVYTAGTGLAAGVDAGLYVTLKEITMFMGWEVKEVQATETASYVLLDSGEILAVGGNDFGELGNGGTTSSSTFNAVTLPTDFGKADELGNTQGAFMFAINTTGSVVAWGENNKGQLGLGVNDNFVATPTVVASLHGMKAQTIVGGLDFSLVLIESSFQVYGAGDTAYTGTDPAIVTGKTTNVFAKSTLVPTPTAEIACGTKHAVALTVSHTSTDSPVYTWGDNSAGQLGLGHDAKSTATPTLVPTLSDSSFERVFAGQEHLIAMESTMIKDEAFYEIYPDGMVMVESLEGTVGRSVLGAVSQYNAAFSKTDVAVIDPVPGVYWIWADGAYPITDEILRFTIRNGAREKSFLFHIPTQVSIKPLADSVSWRYTGDAWVAEVKLRHGIINGLMSQVTMDCMGLVSSSFMLMAMDQASTSWDITVRSMHSTIKTTPIYPYYAKCTLAIDGVDLYSGPLGTQLPMDLTLSSFEIKDQTPYVYYGSQMTACIKPMDMFNRFIPMSIDELDDKVKFVAVYPTTVSSEQTETLEPMGVHQKFYFDEDDQRFCQTIDTNFPVSGQIQALYEGEIIGEEKFVMMRADSGTSKVWVKNPPRWPAAPGKPLTFCATVYNVLGTHKITNAPPLSFDIDIRGTDGILNYNPILDPATGDYCITIAVPPGKYSFTAFFNGVQELQGGSSFEVKAAGKSSSIKSTASTVIDFLLTALAVVMGPVIAAIGLVGGIIIAVGGIVFGVIMTRKGAAGEPKKKGQYSSIDADDFGSAGDQFTYDAI